ncbi:hypothetical protein PQX77_009910 [Marasmius sp. AFHP31]|nr:hypothetical protein PQX77_009910 [Marasmius sp. AFHP31]
MKRPDDSPLPAPLTSRTPIPRYQSRSITRRLASCRNPNQYSTGGEMATPQNAEASSSQVEEPPSSLDASQPKRGVKRRHPEDPRSRRRSAKRRQSELSVDIGTSSEVVDLDAEFEEGSSSESESDSLTDELASTSSATGTEGYKQEDEEVVSAPILEEQHDWTSLGDAIRFAHTHGSHDTANSSPSQSSPPRPTGTVTSPSLSRILNIDPPPLQANTAQSKSPAAATIDLCHSPPIPASTHVHSKGKEKATTTEEKRAVTPVVEAEPQATLADYTCPICFSPPTNATLTPCGHICCGPCLFAAVKSSMKRAQMAGPEDAGARCPVCRATIPGWDGRGGGVIGLKIQATSEEVPDLGQFTAVLRAWTHLHSFPSRAAINQHVYPGARQQQGVGPSLNSSSSRTGYFDSDQDQEQDQERAHSTVWAHRPIASYLASTGDFTGTDTESHSQTDRERGLGDPTTTTIHRSIPIPTTALDDDADDEDFSDSRGDGDAEGERPMSVQIEDLDDLDSSFEHDIYDDEDDNNTDADADATTATHDVNLDLDQMQLNSNEESQSQSEHSTDLGDVSLQEASEEQPSLGFLDEALRFIAAERERWNAQREAGLVSINGSVPLSSEPRRKRRRKRKTPRAHSVTRTSTTSGNPSFTPGSSYTASASTPSLLSTIFQSANANNADDADADADADDSSSSFDQQYPRRPPIHGHPHQSLFKSTPSTPSRQRTRGGGITKQLQPNRKSNANASVNPRLKHASSTPQLRPPSRIVAAPVVSEVNNPRVGQLRSLGKKLEKLFPEDREFLKSVGYGALSASKSYFDGGAGAGEDSGSGSAGNGSRNGTRSGSRSGGNGIFGNFVDTRGGAPTTTTTTTTTTSGGGERLIHVFIDHSNILIGLLNYLKRHPRQHPQHGAGSGGDNHPSSSSYSYPKPPKHLSHSALTLILERGRPVSRRVLVTSSPLYQPMDSAELLGFEVRVFARVPDLGDGMDRDRENQRGGQGQQQQQQQRPGIGGHKRSVSSGSFTGVGGGDAVTASPKKGGRRRAGSVNTNTNTNTNTGGSNGPPAAARKRGHQRGFSAGAGGGTSTESEQGQQLRNGIAAMLSPSTPGGNGSNVSTPGGGGRIRYREQGVDELLQLKLHQALASIDGRPPKGSTIVLATGDGNAGQFNEDGFLGSVRTALKRGWKVELYAWEGGLSRAWKREFGEGSEWGATTRGEGGEGEGPKFRVIGMEQFGSELVEIYF